MHLNCEEIQIILDYLHQLASIGASEIFEDICKLLLKIAKSMFESDNSQEPNVFVWGVSKWDDGSVWG